MSCSKLKDDLPPAASPLTVHESGWIDTASSNFHGKSIRQAGWDMTLCKTCHGFRYDGGPVNVSCRTCHSGAAGPENCTTWHGSSAGPAPPRDLSGNTSSTARGVGAHQTHLLGGTLSNGVVCSECHTIPHTVHSPGHLDSSPTADVVFNGYLATLRTGGGSHQPYPSYQPDSLRCNNTFCHGNFSLDSASSPNQFIFTSRKMQGANRSVLWTGGSSEASCESCHGLPPDGHRFAYPSTCGACHTGIVNDFGQIVDRSKHINGKINVFGQERDF